MLQSIAPLAVFLATLSLGWILDFVQARRMRVRSRRAWRKRIYDL